jgi:hypothetical protein
MIETEEACKILGKTKQFLYNKISEGEINPFVNRRYTKLYYLKNDIINLKERLENEN